MTWLSKNVRTHVVIFTDWREIQITNDQYINLKFKLKDNKFSDPLVIKDADSWEILFDGKCWAIKEFKHKKVDSWWWRLYWICDYWVRHLVIDWGCGNCECREKLWLHYTDFHNRLRDMWFTINYAKDVTDHMLRSYKSKYLVNWKYI